MSAWNRFLGKVRRTASKVGNKVEEIGNEAAATVHAKGLEIQIDEEYENLGRVVYRALNGKENLEEKKQEILNKLDELIAELDAIKTAKAEKRAAGGQGRPAAKKPADACADCTDTDCVECPNKEETSEPAESEADETPDGQ